MCLSGIGLLILLGCSARESLTAEGQDSFIAESEIRVADVSPDSAIIATGTVAGTIELMRLDDGSALRKWKAHKGTIRSVVFSGDGSKISTEGADKKVVIWDVANEKAVCVIEDPKANVSRSETDWENSRIAFSADDKFLYAYGCKWSLPDGELRHRFGARGTVATAKTRLAHLSRNGFTISDFADKDRQQEFKEKGVSVLRLSRDGSYLAVGRAYYAGSLTLFDATKMQKVVPIREIEEWIFTLDFSSSQTELAIAGNSNWIYICDIEKRSISQKLSTSVLNTCVRYSPDGKWLLAVGSNREVRRWSLPDYKPAE